MMRLRDTFRLAALAAASIASACARGDAGPPPPGSAGSSAGGHDGVDAGGTVDVAAADHAEPPPADAGAGLTGSADGGPDAASDPAAPLENGGACGSLFCEDFERGMVDPAIWSPQMGGAGTLEVQQQIVAHGKYAYHVHGSGASGDFAMIISRNAPPALRGSGPLFGRAYVYASTNVGSHIELGFAGSTRDPAVPPAITKGMNFNYMEFAEFANSWQLGFDLFTPAPEIARGFVEEASYPPARDKYPAATWSCVEWEFGDNPDMMVLWVDGKQLAQFDVEHIGFSSVARTAGSVLNGKSSGIIGGYAFFGFGFHSYGASATVDRYFDDIAIDVKRIGCLGEGSSASG